MTSFVTNCRHDRYFAVSEISEISDGKKRDRGFGEYHIAHLRNGGEFYLDDYVVDRLTDPVIAVIPAQPGYNTIQTGNCMDGAPYTIREPVLAWQMMASGEMRPVTIRGPNNGQIGIGVNGVSVEQPSGEIWMPCCDAIFPTFDEYREEELARQRDEEDDRAARHAEREAKRDAEKGEQK